MRPLLRPTVFLLAAVTLISGSVVKSPSNGNFELLILHNNDMHARFEQTSQMSGACTIAGREAGKCYGGFPRVAYVVKEARKAAASGEGPPVLYLNAGDTYTGTAWFTIYKWKIAAEFLNALQPDAVSLGNHEFDNGVSGLTPFIENLTCPVLAANLILTKVPELATETNLRKSVVFNISGVAVGVVGYLTPETKMIAIQNNVEYVDEIVALKEEVSNLKSEGVNIIIALGHSGYLKDIEIAKNVEGIDLVIGGHSNTFLWNGTTPDSEEIQGPYPTYVKQTSGKLVPVVQAYAYTKYLGKLHMLFDSNGDVISIDGNPILLDNSIPQDSEILKIVERYRSDVVNITEEVIGNTSVVLDGLSCQYKECNLGNLIADAMVYHYASEYKGYYWTDAPVAIIQGGGIRSSIANTKLRTNITKGDLLGVMPFEGILVTVKMNGSTLLQMLEHGVSNYDPLDYPGEFLQVSGIHVMFDLRKPSRSRVIKAEARCASCDIPIYSEVKHDQIYNVIMTDFLAKGGDGYWMFEGLPTETLNYNELATTIYYLKQHSPVIPAVEGRVILLDGDDKNSAISISPSSLGNHEFDDGVDGLLPFIKNLTSPVLAANLILDKVPELQNITNLHSSIIILKKGVKIGIIGYLTPETKFLAQKSDVEYEDEIPAIKREVDKLRAKGVQILIALGHSGFLKDLEIAKEVDGIDLVIGGHSNTFLWNGESFTESPESPQGLYPTMVKQSSGRIVPVVQAYAYTKYLGRLHLIFDSAGEVIKCYGYPLLLHQKIPNDIEVMEIVQKYRGDIDRINTEIVGSSLTFLNGEQCRVGECNLGNIITDAILNYTKQNFKNKYTDVNVAIIQGGRIRTSLGRPDTPFNVTRGDWITVLPFSDNLTILTMNGSVFIKALEHSVEAWRTIDSPGQFLQVSGIEVVYDLSKAPGARVRMAKAMCTECSALNEVDENETYKVLTPQFLADGGDGYSIFENLPREILPYNELTCVLDYLKKYSPVYPKESGRIKILNEDTVKLILDGTLTKNDNKPSRSIVVQLNLYLLSISLAFYSFKYLVH